MGVEQDLHSESRVHPVTSERSRSEPPDPAVVRTVLVEVLEAHPEGLTERQIAEALLERLGTPPPGPVQVDLEGLGTLGVVAESERTTDFIWQPR